ncbi:MAG TPA: alpha/beta fold hydrolase [Aliidongia sp.]|nr:alpha/beta fold hydrolase [Aliidongia sp.]
MGWIAGILAIAAAGVAFAVAAGYQMSRPAQAPVGPPPDDLGAETVLIPSPSGSTLRGWFAPGRPGAGGVLLLHGVQGNRLATLPRFRLLHQAGYGVLAIDFQAHGESPGKLITFGQLEALDAAAAVDFLHSRLPAEKLGAIGISLGGAAALVGPKPLPVQALVLESVYPDIDRAIADRIEYRLGPWGRLLEPPFVLVAGPALGISSSVLRPIDRIGEVKAPMFVMAGIEDRYTKIDETREIFARANAPKELWEVPGAGHSDLQAHAGAEYDRRLLDFFGRTLRAVDPAGGGMTPAP